MDNTQTRGIEWCNKRVRIDLIKLRILTGLMYGVEIQNSYANVGFEGFEPFMTLAQTLSEVTPAESTTRKRRRPSAEAVIALAVFKELHHTRQKRMT